MMQEVEVLKTIPELVCSYFSEEQFTLSCTVGCLPVIVDLCYYVVSLIEVLDARKWLGQKEGMRHEISIYRSWKYGTGDDRWCAAQRFIA